MKIKTLNDLINKFSLQEEDGGGEATSGPMTTDTTGSLGQSAEDVFVNKDIGTSPIIDRIDRGIPQYADYFTTRRKKKKGKTKMLSFKSFIDYMSQNLKEETAAKTPSEFSKLVKISDVKKVFKDEVYPLGDEDYVVKIYSKNQAYSYGKMYFIGDNGFAIRLNKRMNSENIVDSVSIWNSWRTEISNKDLNFNVKPDAILLTYGLSVQKCIEVAYSVYKNKEPKIINLNQISIEKDNKNANKEFNDILKEKGKEELNFTELLDIANEMGYDVKEPGDGSLKVSLVVPMQIPSEEYVIPYKTEYKIFGENQKLVDDSGLMINPVNVQSFVSSKVSAENLLNYLNNLYKENLINNLSAESVIFAAKVIESGHPNWLKLLTPKLK